MRLLVAVVALVGPGAALAQCRPALAEPCVIDLRGENAPRASSACSDETWKGHLGFTLPQRFADADENGWNEVVLELDLDPRRGCGCAVFRVTFDGDPSGVTVNIGDSPTNDGFGGDAWSTLFDAELMIEGRDLTVYGSEQPESLGASQIFGMRLLPIIGGALELEICDQSVRLAIDPAGDQEEFFVFFNTYLSRDLIAIRQPPEKQTSPATAPDASLYAAFNRVIATRSGRPSKNRFGSGVRRVEISLTP